METNTDKGIEGIDIWASQPKRRRRSSDKSILSSKDVCAILDSCLRCRVSRFSFRCAGLEFSAQWATDAGEAVGTGMSPLQVDGLEEVSQGRRDSLEDLGNLVDDELEMLKITDPLQYEKFLADEAKK
jgi:hypothetical protein